MERSLQSPVILQEIFKNLPFKELNTCSQVCSVWYEIAKVSKKNRKHLLWYFCKNCEDHPKDTCEIAFSKFINDLYCKPEFAIVFSTVRKIAWKKNKKTGQNVKKMLMMTDPCAFSKTLPSFCNLAFCIAPGITGTMQDCDVMDELEHGNGGITALCFPNLSNVAIHKFKISDLKKNRLRPQVVIPPQESVKCLLIFMCGIRCIKDERALMNYVNAKEVTFGVGGARINKAFIKQQNANKLKLNEGSFAIAFTGDNVRSASVILNPEIETAEDVEKKLKQLQKTNITNGQCVAFAFTCVARGETYYKKRNVESEIFRKLFPGIPLFGVFANGEIGVTYLPNFSEESSTCIVRDKEMFHFYSTVFVLISVMR